jgi:hypothetical protein
MLQSSIAVSREMLNCETLLFSMRDCRQLNKLFVQFVYLPVERDVANRKYLRAIRYSD